MATSIPVLYQDKDTIIHRRDPRIKMLLIALLFVFLFLAPSWQWMLGLVATGLVTAVLSRVNWKWLAVLWLIQVPSFLVIMGLPLWQQWQAGELFTMNDDISASLRLILAWSGAIFLSVSLASTMDANDFVKGLRGLRAPAAVALAVGLSYRLLYTTLSEALQIVDSMKVKGVDLETKNPVRLIRNAMKLSLPILFSVLRRGPTLMASLEMRGSLHRSARRQFPLNAGDWMLLAAGVIAVGLATGQRFGLLEALTG